MTCSGVSVVETSVIVSSGMGSSGAGRTREKRKGAVVIRERVAVSRGALVLVAL